MLFEGAIEADLWNVTSTRFVNARAQWKWMNCASYDISKRVIVCRVGHNVVLLSVTGFVFSKFQPYKFVLNVTLGMCRSM